MPNSPLIQRFEHDRWVKVRALDLRTGDLFAYGKQTAVVKSTPFKEDGRTVIPAEPYDPGPITIHLGSPYTGMVMDYTNSALQTFEDGTGLITEFEGGSCAVFSPRLPLDELEAFLKENIDKYITFFEANEAQLEQGIAVPMERFWD